MSGDIPTQQHTKQALIMMQHAERCGSASRIKNGKNTSNDHRPDSSGVGGAEVVRILSPNGSVIK